MDMIKLLPTFDAPAIARALARAREQQTSAGYPGEGHRGWLARTLYSVHHGLADWAREESALAGLIDRLGTPVVFARFMTLEPGGVINEHRDAFLGERVVRLHVPIKTNDQAQLFINGRLCRWLPGELWYGDFSLPHWGANHGSPDRVHLVIDAPITRELASLFPAGTLPQSLERRIRDGVASDHIAYELSRFAMRFSLPPGFCLPMSGLAPLPAQASGEIRVCGDELWVCINDQPLLKVNPLSEDAADVIGLPRAARLHFLFADDCAVSATLLIDGIPSAPPHFQATTD
ncbi:MAG: aspartyl/asparaginyl beta-hydroxylase domain-containing protein [Pyrinomonadaceae bacterium]